jgi:hypothetical protein
MNGLSVTAGTLLSPSQVADTSWKIVGTADFDGMAAVTWFGIIKWTGESQFGS